MKKMKMKKIDLVIILLLILTLGRLIWVYPSLPQTIPTHWNLAGEIDGWGGKGTIWFIYCMTWAVYGLFFLMPKIDPKGYNYQKFQGVYDIFKLVLTVFLVGLLEVSIQASFNPTGVKIERLVPAAVSILIIVIGNYLPKCKHNYSFGIKTPWTLASERVWNNTHRFSGPIWVACGFVSLIASLVSSSTISGTISFIALIIPVVICMVYSFVDFKKGENHEKTN